MAKIKNNIFYMPSLPTIYKLNMQPNNVLYCFNSTGVKITKNEENLSK